MLTFDEYEAYYRKNGKCIDQSYRAKNKLTDAAILRKYDNYLRKEEARLTKILNQGRDEKWDAVKAEVFKRDSYTCRLSPILTDEEWTLFFNCGGFTLTELDPAHVIPRSISSNLYYEPKNIVSLDRVFHSRLDFNLHPLTGSPITRKAKEAWWIRIVGLDIWEWLLENK